MDRALHHSAEHPASSTRPATAEVSAAAIHRGPPAKASQRPVGRTPLHYTAALLYTAANSAGENPVAGTLATAL